MVLIKKTYTKIVSNSKYCINCRSCKHRLINKLCLNCEILLFPERFHGCGFCKRPIRKKFCCSICENGFIEWINNVVHPISNTSILIRSSAKYILDKSIDNKEIKHSPFIIRTNDSYYKWPGFYAGSTNKFSNIINNNDGFYPLWIIPKLSQP